MVKKRRCVKCWTYADDYENITGTTLELRPGRRHGGGPHCADACKQALSIKADCIGAGVGAMDMREQAAQYARQLGWRVETFVSAALQMPAIKNFALRDSLAGRDRPHLPNGVYCGAQVAAENGIGIPCNREGVCQAYRPCKLAGADAVNLDPPTELTLTDAYHRTDRKAWWFGRQVEGVGIVRVWLANPGKGRFRHSVFVDGILVTREWSKTKDEAVIAIDEIIQSFETPSGLRTIDKARSRANRSSPLGIYEWNI